MVSEMWGSHSGFAEDLRHLECGSVSLGDRLPTFRMVAVPSKRPEQLTKKQNVK